MLSRCSLERTILRERKKDIPCKWKSEKKTEVAILLPDKIDFEIEEELYFEDASSNVQERVKSEK